MYGSTPCSKRTYTLLPYPTPYRSRPADRYQFSPGRGIQIRNTAQQGNRIWMPGIGEHFAYRSLFPQTARVHHRHAVGMARDDTQVMINEQDRHADLAPQIAEQIEDLGLNRTVALRWRIVGTHHFR